MGLAIQARQEAGASYDLQRAVVEENQMLVAEDNTGAWHVGSGKEVAAKLGVFTWSPASLTPLCAPCLP